MFDIVAIYTLQELVLSCPVTTVQGSQACLQHVKLYTTSTKQAINNTPTSTSGCFLIDAISLSLAMINSVSTKVSRPVVIHMLCNSLKFIKMTRVEKKALDVLFLISSTTRTKYCGGSPYTMFECRRDVWDENFQGRHSRRNDVFIN